MYYKQEDETQGIKKMNYIIVFALIYLTSSFVSLSIPGIINMTMLITLGAFSCVYNIKDIKISYKSFIILCILSINALIVFLVYQDSIYQYAILFISMISAYMISISIQYKEFIKIYVKIMYILCIISLIAYFISLISLDLFSIFPIQENSAGTKVYNMIFTVLHISDYIKRNFGLFWEPGAFQTFINLALFFEMFTAKVPNSKVVTILIITIITTISTTGYIATLLICIAYISSKKKKNLEIKKSNKKIIRNIILLLVVSFFVFMALPNTYKYQLTGKIMTIFSNTSSNSIDDSTMVRIDAVKYPFEAFINSYLFGVGYDNFYELAKNKCSNMVTATIINWFSIFGLFWGVICSYMFCMTPIKMINSNYIVKILVCVSFMLIIFTEDYHRNSAIFLIIFYGIDIMFINKRNFTKDKRSFINK
ncbi:O-antigen ligase family protein [Paraclostridium bifermentans]|uniref:O-antigen ligase family protein n=1 Tax=Paraclostridium bifermentans TaxID=1490 RepID=UPI001FF68AF3|nr:O-antigen ligase family protein [Paraclostridium bifermentans]UOW67241.1 O-antigen ligase family protein [Paraclostridium bifermentans]